MPFRNSIRIENPDIKIFRAVFLDGSVEIGSIPSPCSMLLPPAVYRLHSLADVNLVVDSATDLVDG